MHSGSATLRSQSSLNLVNKQWFVIFVTKESFMFWVDLFSLQLFLVFVLCMFYDLVLKALPVVPWQIPICFTKEGLNFSPYVAIFSSKLPGWEGGSRVSFVIRFLCPPPPLLLCGTPHFLAESRAFSRNAFLFARPKRRAMDFLHLNRKKASSVFQDLVVTCRACFTSLFLVSCSVGHPMISLG